MSVTLTPIVNTNTFGVWKDRTNELISAVADTASLGGTITDNPNASLWINGDITATANVASDVINPYNTAIGFNLVTINGDTRLEGDSYIDGELTVGNDGSGNSTITFADSNEADSWKLTADHQNQFSLTNADGSKALTINESTNTISATGLTLDASILPTSGAFPNGLTANLIGDVYANNGINVVLNNGTDGTDATFTGTASVASIVESLNDADGNIQFDSDDIDEGTTNKFATNTNIRAALGFSDNSIDIDSDGEITLIQQITTTSNPTFANLTVTQCKLFGGTGTAGNTYLEGSAPANVGQMNIYADGVNSAIHKKNEHIFYGAVEIEDVVAGGACRLDVKGPIRSDDDITAFHSFSDINLKENIETIDNALDKVDSINGYTFNYKTKPDTRISGVIAQEMQAVLPEVVYDVDDSLAVRYEGIVPLLIEAIKELKTEVEELKSKKCSCNDC